ncbi:MAG: aminotransferase class V-fold PLP-dependent enzyme [Parvularculaceae bacterium]
MLRDRFHLPGEHYFLSHSIGAQPVAYDAFFERSFSSPWRDAASETWNFWLEAIDGFCGGLAVLIGADAADICPQTNISIALSKILTGLPPREGRDKIVLAEDDFPTVGFALGQGARLGYKLEFLPGGPRLADPDAWSRAFEEDVALVLATHVYSNSAVMAPVAQIAQRAREQGVISVLDLAQSAGAVPVRLNDWRPDFAVGTSVKYLCGGPGAAWLWASPDTAHLMNPLEVGWFSHENPFEFDIRNFRYAEGAARFWGGTPSVAPYAGARAGQAIIAAAGVEKIHAHNQHLLSRLFGALPQGAIASATKEGARGSSALIRVKDAQAAERKLNADGIGCDIRKGCLRVSVHLYTEEADIDALIAAVEPYL